MRKSWTQARSRDDALFTSASNALAPSDYLGIHRFPTQNRNRMSGWNTQYHLNVAGHVDTGIEALKGTLASMCILNNFPIGATISVNVDVANGTFLSKMGLLDIVKIFAMACDGAELMTLFNFGMNDVNTSIRLCTSASRFYKKSSRSQAPFCGVHHQALRSCGL